MNALTRASAREVISAAGRALDVAAELVAHGREDLGGEVIEMEPGGLEGEPFPPLGIPGEQRAEMDVLDLAVVILERRPFRTARERWHARGHALSSRLGLTWR